MVAQRDKRALTAEDNSQFPCRLPCMFLHGGLKGKVLERTLGESGLHKPGLFIVVARTHNSEQTSPESISLTQSRCDETRNS